MGKISGKYIMLSFDVEEFDLPLESGGNISLEEQMHISYNGTVDILRILQIYKVPATFYITANFALHHPELVKKISENHEIASHGFHHSSFKNEDLIQSRFTLEKIINKPVYGYRMARMMPVKDSEIVKAGYRYNSSLNPTYIPGRYNNLLKNRTVAHSNNLITLPSSVTPVFRLPLFWLTFKNIPYLMFYLLSKWTLKHDGYLNIYFHPWEFCEQINNPDFKVPAYMRRFSNRILLERLEKYIAEISNHAEFTTTFNFLNLIYKGI